MGTKLIDRVKSWIPVSRRSHNEAIAKLRKEHAQQIQGLCSVHAKEIEACAETADKLIQRITKRRFAHDRDRDIFEVRVMFDGRMFGGAQRHEMQFLGHRIGRQVEAEIATCRFMVSAVSY